MTQKSLLLFEEFPGLQEKIPHVSLVKKTEVSQLKSLSEELNANLWIKRDDQTTDVYGGNKPRKLEFTLADVIEKQKTDVLTYGGTGSNHCLATSIFAQQLDITPVLVLFNQPLTADVQKKLLIFYSLGAEMLGPYGEIWGLAHFLLFKRFRKKTYYLPAGGSSPLGVLGFVNAALELKSQIENGEMPKPDYLFVTCGTLGTMAGLLLGCKLANLKIEIIGVRVVQTFVSYYNWTFSFDNAARKLARKTLNYLRKRDESIPKVEFKEKPTILHDFYGGGYGKVTPEGVEAIDLMKKYENITLDTTYTGKTFAALLNFIKEKGLTEEIILFWNTYNSRDISKLKNPEITYEDLPKSFHKLFLEDLLVNSK
ncbi:MAG: pyridoxal-phosphate dependent enzyme [Candidatus Helarchaeota archaeon]|nr:pyridoxal-phosphate dependent enzyme [Candidatus Helarchaeota archaeon]